LLHWAELESRALELGHALLQTYHVRGENPALHEVLQRAALAAGLDATAAREALSSNAFAAEVRAAVRHWQRGGIHAVRSVIIDGRRLIQGGQPVEVFERALREG